VRAAAAELLQKGMAMSDMAGCIINMSRSNSGEVGLLSSIVPPAALMPVPQLKRESNGSGNTVTIRPGGLSWRLSEPIETHK